MLVATLRRNEWARISPVKPFIVGGQLYLGMMWQSKKALDLLRDPRCTIHNTVSDRQATEGEFKVYGRAVNVTDLAERRRFGDAVFNKIGFRAEEPEFHCFAIDIENVVSAKLRDEQFHHRVWKAGG